MLHIRSSKNSKFQLIQDNGITIKNHKNVDVFDEIIENFNGSFKVKYGKFYSVFDSSGCVFKDWKGNFQFEKIKWFNNGHICTYAKKKHYVTTADNFPVYDWKKNVAFEYCFDNGTLVSKKNGKYFATQLDGTVFKSWHGETSFIKIVDSMNILFISQQGRNYYITNLDGTAWHDWKSVQVFNDSILQYLDLGYIFSHFKNQCYITDLNGNSVKDWQGNTDFYDVSCGLTISKINNSFFVTDLPENKPWKNWIGHQTFHYFKIEYERCITQEFDDSTIYLSDRNGGIIEMDKRYDNEHHQQREYPFGEKVVLLKENGILFQNHQGLFEFDLIYLHTDGSIKYQNNGIYELLEKNETLFKDWTGATQFNYVHRYYDGSTETRIGNKTFLTKSNGKPFRDWQGNKAFEAVQMSDDFIILTINGITYKTDKNGRKLEDKQNPIKKLLQLLKNNE